MKNIIGNALTLTLFGESHGDAIGAVIDGLSPGIKIDSEYIDARLAQRKPYGKGSTKRREPDKVEIISGVFEGYTTGTPLTAVIRNCDTRSRDYENISRIARPSHADLTGFYKYGGYEDYRGGGHFSGRITAALVASCAIVMKALEDKGILIGTHIKACHGAKDREFENYEKDIKFLKNSIFPVLGDGKAIEAEILKAAEEGDSVGGILETAVLNMPAGVGEPWFDTIEGMLAHAVFSVPAVKGIEFGEGFGITDMKGSEANDQMRYENGKVVTATNRNGGINGGISNGMPIIFRTAVKPTPSIYKEQKSIDFKEEKDAKLLIKGRHDPAIVHRARAVVDAVTAFVLADLLISRYGTDFLRSKI
ncbi:MAG: chorismate synthase [Anaerovoracaceae bacterium]|nr:chorismate synthase [Bacillota bacterium]MEE0517916.1 chorismate synthase [Anaerovoracaceae bacterium]